MLGVFFADILYSKIIYYQSKADRAPLVDPKTWCDFALAVAVLLQPYLQQFLG